MTPEPTEALSAAMIEAGSRVLCRAYEIDDGFSEEQADRHAASGMGLNFRKEARDCYLAMEAAREPEAGKLREALVADLAEALEDANMLIRVGGVTFREMTRARERNARLIALSRNQGDGR